jgi:hypothetical protein
VGVDRSLVVADLREGQRVPVDEVLKRGLVAGPGDTVEIDLAGPSFACRFDRRGFTVAGTSSRRPEPEPDWSACDIDAVERAATDERRREPQRFRHNQVGCRLRRRRSVGCG